MEQLQIQNLYDLTQTIAAPLFEGRYLSLGASS